MILEYMKPPFVLLASLSIHAGFPLGSLARQSGNRPGWMHTVERQHQSSRAPTVICTQDQAFQRRLFLTMPPLRVPLSLLYTIRDRSGRKTIAEPVAA